MLNAYHVGDDIRNFPIYPKLKTAASSAEPPFVARGSNGEGAPRNPIPEFKQYQ
jgi:hypothetical protein